MHIDTIRRKKKRGERPQKKKKILVYGSEAAGGPTTGEDGVNGDRKELLPLKREVRLEKSRQKDRRRGFLKSEVGGR